MPELVEEIHQQTPNVGAVIVLVGHDEDAAVAQAAAVLVRLARLEPDDLFELGNLLGQLHFRGTAVLDVHDFPPQWEHAERLALSLRKTAESHGFGGIALREDEGAGGGLGGGACPSSVLKLWDAIDFALLLSIRLFVILVVLFFLSDHERIDQIELALNLFEHVLGQLARRAKGRALGGQRLFGLRREGGILDLGRHKDRQILLDERGLDLDLLLGLEELRNVRDDLVENVIDMGPALGGPDAVDERYL